MAALTALQTYPGAQNSEDSLTAPFRYDPMSGPSRWSQEIDLRDSLSLTDTTPIPKRLFSWRSGGPPLAAESSGHMATWNGQGITQLCPRAGWTATYPVTDGPPTLGDRGPILNRNHNPWADE